MTKGGVALGMTPHQMTAGAYPSVTLRTGLGRDRQGQAFLAQDKYTVVTGEKKYTMRYQPNYYAAKENELFLIEGSNNTLEISLKNGNANDKLDLRTGDKIKISQDLHNEDAKDSRRRKMVNGKKV